MLDKPNKIPLLDRNKQRRIIEAKRRVLEAKRELRRAELSLALLTGKN